MYAYNALIFSDKYNYFANYKINLIFHLMFDHRTHISIHRNTHITKS